MVLALLDPKRLVAQRGQWFTGTLFRRALWLVSVLPGVVWLWAGQLPAFVIWLGAASLVGWLAAWLVNARGAARAKS